MANGFFKTMDQIVDTRFLARRDIHRMIAFERQRPDNGLGNIAGIDEIAGLVAVAENRKALMLGQKLTENADDAAFALFTLPFTVNIGKAENRRIHTV